jgi:hypothetical protein
MSVATATDGSLLASYRTDSRILTEHPCNVLDGAEDVPRRFDNQSTVSPRPLA